ncbi:hypothetical protein ACU6ZS_13915 [Klebsiella aerogenes]|uniref:hypothetical protein n=1 Tax=Klebsiella aerogenes TaxID=548 RepID=UPI002298B2C8|nr:hypothetical protein [Klebsiella aerogenes]
MAIYYGESSKGFYDMDFANYALPDDAIEVTEEQRDALILESMSAEEIDYSGE